VYAKEYFHPFNPTPLKEKPLIIVGPSGVGKMTLIDAVLEKFGQLFERKRTVTTRPKREIEKAEKNFIFVTIEEFKKMENAGAFIETRQRDGVYHGTSYTELQRIKSSGKIPIIEVDCEGADKINLQALEANFLFIYPPSFEELRKRIGNRIETEKEFKLRIKEAISEI
jgi:guanylate kinase